MKNKFNILLLIFLISHLNFALAGDVASDESVSDKKMIIQTSFLTYHYQPSLEHKNVKMLGLERESNDKKIDGIIFFNNSFGQPSFYLYPFGGKVENILNNPGNYLKYSCGLLYGYKGKYQNKVDFNYKGYAPACIPAIGYERNEYQMQLNLLGTAGLMLQFNFGY